jgi:hypothetical protein
MGSATFPAIVRPMRLDRSAYHQDFYRHYEDGIASLDKLERGQHFEEHGFPSWEAFAAGHWQQALDLIGQRRPAYTDQARRRDQLNITERRLRVVEFPLTPYVQWELHVLRLRAELGEHIRVTDAADLAGIEHDRPVPDLVLLGRTVLYEVVYDAQGRPDGCRRTTDADLIADTSTAFTALWERGEPFDAFFTREIAPLPPPPAASS